MSILHKRTAALLLFGAGVLIGCFFFGLAVWGDLEASLFSSNITADKSLTSMSCPVMINTNETAEVSAVLVNPFDKVLHVMVRSQISNGFLTYKREDLQQGDLQVGERKKVSWEVTPDDAVWERLIFARVYQYASALEKSKGGSCGILVVDFPYLTGFQISALLIGLSLAAMGAGLALWFKINRPIHGKILESTRAVVALAVIVTVGILTAIFAMWFFGLLMLLLAAILVIAVVANLNNA